jgi:hypothetical protein
MQKLFGGFLLVAATVLFFYRAWLFGALFLLISLALMFSWKSDADGSGDFGYSSDDSDSSDSGGGSDGGGD